MNSAPYPAYYNPALGDLQTERMFLRNRTRERLSEMLEQSHEQQMAFFGFDDPGDLKQKLVRIRLALQNARPDYRIFDLLDKNSGIVMGSCGYHNWIPEHFRAELGYGLEEKFRKKGLMTEALKTLIPYAFHSMNLNRIEAMISPQNPPSQRLVEAWGFRREGLMRGHYFTGGKFEDSLIYALLREDFDAALGPVDPD